MNKSILAALVFLAAFGAAAQLAPTDGDVEGIGNVSASGVKIPLYNHGELRLMLRASSFEQRGTVIYANSAVIDVIRRNAELDDLQIGEPAVYTIDSSLFEVANYWHNRKSSEGVIFSGAAQVDNENRIAQGSDIVQVRTPQLDIDGVGFSANYEKRQVTVTRNVHIILRFGGEEMLECFASGNFKLLDSIPGIGRFAEVWSDSLSIDFQSGEVTLEGMVRLEESGSTIECDKVILMLGRTSAAADGKSPDEMSELGISGVSKAECFGNVKMTRHDRKNPENVQAAKADYALYDLETGTIRLSGGEPTVTSGTNSLSGNEMVFEKRSGLLTVSGAATLVAELPGENGAPVRKVTIRSDKMSFSQLNNYAEAVGNVLVTDERGALHTEKIELVLKDGLKANNPSGDAAGAVELGGLDFAAGSKAIEKITCSGGVNFFSNDGGEGESELADYDYATGNITLHGKTRPWVKQRGSRLEGGKIVLDQKDRKLLVTGDAVIAMTQGGGRVVANSESMDMDLNDNIGHLRGGVKVVYNDSTVNCDELTIYLADKPGTAPKAAAAPASFDGGNFDKTLDKLQCNGNVVCVDPRGKLECGTLTISFTQGASGPELARADFSGGVKVSGTGVEFTELVPDGTKLPEKAAADGNAESSMTCKRGYIDFPGNFAEFSEDVVVTDPRINITSDVFRAWFQDRTAEVIAEENKPVKPKFESPEMEFEPEMKSSVPRHIKIGETKNLTRIEFAGHVHITGTDEHGTRFSASGESAVYTVADRMIEMATVNGVNPVLTRGGTVAECSTVRVDVSKADPEPEGSDMRIISFEPDWEER